MPAEVVTIIIAVAIILSIFYAAIGEVIRNETSSTSLTNKPAKARETIGYETSNATTAYRPGTRIVQDDETDQSAYESILGEHNRVYYLMKFARFDQYPNRLHANWNWPAFLFSWVWAIYRKMYGMAFVLFVAWMLAIGVEVTSQLQTISAGIMLVVKAVFAIYANSIYHSNIRQKIGEVQTLTDNKLKQLEYLKSIGGVNVAGTVIALVVWVALVSVLQNTILR